RPQPLGHAHPGLGVGDVPRHLVDELLERVRALDLEEAPAVGVGVDVGDGLLLQLGVVGLGPFRRAQQPRLLAVPRRVDDRALRRPAGCVQRAQGLGLGHEGDEAADRVFVTVRAWARSTPLALSGVAPTPGVSGSPGYKGMSATDPRWAPASLR